MNSKFAEVSLRRVEPSPVIEPRKKDKQRKCLKGISEAQMLLHDIAPTSLFRKMFEFSKCSQFRMMCSSTISFRVHAKSYSISDMDWIVRLTAESSDAEWLWTGRRDEDGSRLLGYIFQHRSIDAAYRKDVFDSEWIRVSSSACWIDPAFNIRHQ